MELYLYFLVLLAGVFAGFVTTLAGLGSVITFYVLTDILQLDGNIANATNRLGILAMCLTALPTFHKKGHLNLAKDWRIITYLSTGAIGGFVLALYTDGEAFKEVFKYLLFVMLALVLLNPKRWIQATDFSHQLNWWVAAPIFLLMGFYAGFIQLGTAIFFVVFLAIYGKYSLVDANGIKLATFGFYTFFGIIIFAANGLVDWGIGLTLAVGQGGGAFFTAKFATSHPKANVFVRYLLIFMLIIAIIKLFKVYEYISWG